MIMHKTHHRTLENDHRTTQWHYDVTMEYIMMSEDIITSHK